MTSPPTPPKREEESASRRIRWGIIGTGQIAHAFAYGLTFLPQAQLVAVGSRQMSKADLFARRFKIEHAHGSYADLVAGADVDVVYIATPHPFHKENALLALNAGKAVVCEKPFAMSADEAQEVLAVARSKRLFAMEAMWSRFLPAMQAVRQLVNGGAIGKLKNVQASFGFSVIFNPFGRLFNPALGGGALMDVGIYPLSLAHWLLGEPSHVVASGHAAPTGVDEAMSAILSYEDGATAAIAASLRGALSNDATILGSQGHIYIHKPWWRANTITLTRNGCPPETRAFPVEGNGYNYEAAEVMRCISEGRIESPVMPLADSLNVMRVVDRVREHMPLTAAAPWRLAA